MTCIASDTKRPAPRRSWATPGDAGMANLAHGSPIAQARAAGVEAHRARAAMLLALDAGELTVAGLLDLAVVDPSLAKIKLIDVLLCCKGWSRAAGLRAISRLTHGRYPPRPEYAKLAWITRSNASPERRERYLELCRQHDSRTIPWVGYPFEPPPD